MIYSYTPFLRIYILPVMSLMDLELIFEMVVYSTALLFSQGYCEDQKRTRMCARALRTKTRTNMGVYDADLMADEKATREKAALVYDLLVNWSHVRLPTGQAGIQPPPLLRLEGVWHLQESTF